MFTQLKKLLLLMTVLSLPLMATVKYIPIMVDDIIIIVSDPAPVSLVLGEDMTVEEDETKVLRPAIDHPERIVSYIWTENGEILSEESTLSTALLSKGIHTIVLTVKDKDGNSVSDEISIAIGVQFPVAITKVETLHVGNDNAEIHWELNRYATGQVEYGETTDYGQFSIKETSFKYKAHTQPLKNLQPDSLYHYRVISEDQDGNKVVSEDRTFRTLEDRNPLEPIDYTNKMIKLKNPNFNKDELDSAGLSGYITHKYEYEIDSNGTEKRILKGIMPATNIHHFSTDSHTDDGSGSMEINIKEAAYYGKSLLSPTFSVKAGKKYLLRLYMKIVGERKGQNVLIGLWGLRGFGVYWNSANIGTWEEVLIPFVAKEDKDDIRIHIFIGPRGFSTTTLHKKISNYEYEEPEKVREDGSNIDTSARVFVDDFSIIETGNIVSNETYTKKIPFESSNIKIDERGNWFVKEKDGNWKSIFPKLIYRASGVGVDRYKTYADYGFTGISDIWKDSQLEMAKEAGLKYNMLIANPAIRKNHFSNIKRSIQYIKDIDQQSFVIGYNFDNENDWLQDYQYKVDFAEYVNTIDKDPKTGKRARPIYILNGNYGVTRNYKSRYADLMDVTGTYVGTGSVGGAVSEPLSTMKVIDHSHNQMAPVSMIQLQSYLSEKFIPSLFYGIIQGGTAVNVWRDGTTFGGSEVDFTKNVWGKVIKDVFKKVDRMLPIIREPKSVFWRVTSDVSTIRLGERDHDGNSYLIISNHSDKDETIILTFEGLDNLEAYDYFTDEYIGSIENGKLSLKIGHYNDGYKVIKFK